MSSSAPDLPMHHSLSNTLLSVVFVEFSLGTVILILRTYTIFFVTRKAGKWSYMWASIAWVGGLIHAIMTAMSAHYGMGTDIYELTVPHIIGALKWSWIADAVSRLTATLARVAVVAFIYEVQTKSSYRWRKIFLWFMAISNMVLSIFLIFVLFFHCTPPSYAWNKTIPGGRCPLDKFNLYLGTVVTSYGGLSDLILAIYPVTIIAGLQMPLKVKLSISTLMGMGVLACVCAIMVAYNLQVVSNTTNPTYVLAPLAIWASTEMWMILIASSAAPLWPLAKKVFGIKMGSSAVSSEKRYYKSGQSGNSRTSYMARSSKSKTSPLITTDTYDQSPEREGAGGIGAESRSVITSDSRPESEAIERPRQALQPTAI